jgi:transcriptional regulator with XRE-family HTH domain
MDYKIDFTIASSKQIEIALCKQLRKIRLARNITQEKLAEEAGLSIRTIYTLEKGLGVSLDTFIRVLIALNIQHNLEVLLPDPEIKPIDLLIKKKKERERASTGSSKYKDIAWVWGDEKDNRKS